MTRRLRRLGDGLAVAILAALAVCMSGAALSMEMELVDDTLILHGSSIQLDDWVKYRELTQGKRFVAGYCHSACTYMFLAGERRQVAANYPLNRTHLGFHGVYDSFFGRLEELPKERYEQTELRMFRLRTDNFAGPTPESIPGVKEVGTRELAKMLAGEAAIELVALLDALAGDRPVLVFSINSQNWLSANAVLRAAKSRKNIYWYRGGIDAWRAARLPSVPTAPVGAAAILD